jgi:decaprenylphospho-beta-D-ribofuranose 2-oxidase
MSATELTNRVRRPGVQRVLSGWGRTSHSRARVTHAHSTEDVLATLVESAGVIARGAGRCYGDAAQNDGGDVLDMTAMNQVISIDRERGSITAQAGATIAQMMTSLAPHKLTLPVVPGTRHVTLAGAVASDIHGKNHHRDGGLARHVTALSLCTPTGACLEISPEVNSELFYATLGGMGLTGVVVQATLRAEPLAAPWVLANTDRTDSFEQTLALMSGEERHRYSVAWLDLLADGPQLGRAVVSSADPWPAGSSPPSGGRRRATYPGALSRRPALEIPHGFPAALLRPSGMRAFNTLRWRAAPRRERERPLTLAPYFFPLDALGAWNRLYGQGGFIQYQFVVPSGREAELVRCVRLLRLRRLPVYLAVLKRLGPEFGGPLSFPLEGWTLAADMPAAAPGLMAALDELDEVVAGCGGRVYLTKDARLRRETMAAMYPELDRFRAQRAPVDPGGVLRSDLARRLGLCEAAR